MATTFDLVREFEESADPDGITRRMVQRDEITRENYRQHAADIKANLDRVFRDEGGLRLSEEQVADVLRHYLLSEWPIRSAEF